MALTRAFRETLYQRAQRDAGFRKALLREAMNAYLAGDEATGKAVLRDAVVPKAGLGREMAARNISGKPSSKPL